MTVSPQRRQTLRSCRLVAALLGCTFGWVALLTFDLADRPNPFVWPHAEPSHNACGRAGAWAAYHLFRYLGDGVWPLMLLLTLGAVVRFLRRPLRDWPLRLIGLGLFVGVTSVATSLLYRDAADGLVEGRGGVVGAALGAWLMEYFSRLGGTLVLVCALVVAVLLTVDDLYFAFRTGWAWVRRNGTAAAHTVIRAGLERRGMTPVLVGAGDASDGFGIAAGEDDSNRPRADAAERTKQRRAAAAAEPAADADEGEPRADERPGPPERELIVRMLGRNRAEGKLPPSAWPKELGDYVLPPLALLRDAEINYIAAQEQVVRAKAAVLERTLTEFRIDARVVEIDTGPVITLFEVDLAPGVKSSQISSLANDIARALKAPAVRVVATLPGKNTIGIEVPNVEKEQVRLKELITLGGVKPTKMAIPLFLGKDAGGGPLIVDAATMPHMLVAGTTGSGKSVCLNALVMSILMTQRPDHVKLILIDPKMVELSIFKDIPHLMCPIVTDMQRAELILQWATTKMDERYELLAEAGVKDISAYNRLGKEQIYERFQPTTDAEKLQIPTHLPYIVILIDELADLMMTSGKEVEHHLSRLAQKSRAVGVHLIVATQRPQANVVTGLVKSNLPCRIAFRVASRMDSRIVLDQNGAEVLMGQGDMLFLPPGSAKLIRAQGTFVEDDELRAVIKDLAGKAQPHFHHELVALKPPDDEGDGGRDPLFDDAVTIMAQSRRGSVSLLQRRLEIGYSRASRLIDQMAAAGIVGEYKGSQAREVLITEKEWEEIRKQRDRDTAEEDTTSPRRAEARIDAVAADDE